MDLPLKPRKMSPKVQNGGTSVPTKGLQTLKSKIDKSHWSIGDSRTPVFYFLHKKRQFAGSNILEMFTCDVQAGMKSLQYLLEKPSVDL